MKKDFSNLYGSLYLPVIVCQNKRELPIAYMNPQAGLLFSPTHSAQLRIRQETVSLGTFTDIARFDSRDQRELFFDLLFNMGHVDDFSTQMVTFENRALTVRLSAATISIQSAQDYVVVYIVQTAAMHAQEGECYDSRFSTIINAAFMTGDVDASVQTVLALSGSHVDVSRAYIFEEISPTTTRNTYEWCGKGVEPAIQELQNLDKADYPYDLIVNAGMFITDDVHTLPDGDRQILEAQGIESIAIIPFYDNGKPLGYVGFDDCAKSRKWSHDEIQFLSSISIILAVLIKRRNAERSVRNTLEILQIITDSTQDLVYANSLNDYRVKFVSRSAIEATGMSADEVIGKHCWEVFKDKQDGPCSFCPMTKIRLEPDADRSEPYVWEYHNSRTGKTYLAKDYILKWVDGEYVHVETATDISSRIDYEQKLQQLASMDTMTGIYNRAWGNRLLGEKFEEDVRRTLCFLDLDGLKQANDQFGHEAGDAFLKATVKLIRGRMAQNEMMCRWGGDEFLVLLDGDEAYAQAFLDALMADVQTYNQSGEQPVPIAFSVGMVPFARQDGITLDKLIGQADQMMYQDKMQKRGYKRRREDQSR